MRVKIRVNKSILLILLLLAINSLCGQTSENFSKQLTKALSNGDSYAISDYFGSYLMVHIEDYQKVISAQQAKTRLTNFFYKNKITSVTLIKSGDKETQQYCIWKYESNDKQWRIYMLLTSENNQPLIHQIDIEIAPEL